MPGWLVAVLWLVGVWIVAIVVLAIAGRRSAARELATLLPNLVVLFRGLLRDPRVPRGSKALLWFGAFIPQFVDPTGNYVGQIILLGATAMATAALADGAYAVLAGRTGRFMSARRIGLPSQISGSFLIGGGMWLAITRVR